MQNRPTTLQKRPDMYKRPTNLQKRPTNLQKRRTNMQKTTLGALAFKDVFTGGAKETYYYAKET